MVKNILLVFIILISVSSCANNYKQAPKAAKGVIDLRNWDFEKDGIIKLDGEWEFYYKSFKNMDEIIQSKNGYFISPKVQQYFEINQLNLNSLSYYTYHIKVLKGNNTKRLSLRFPPPRSSFKLFVNNNLIGQAGELGMNKDDSKPEYKTDIYQFVTDKDTIDVVFWVSNFHYWKGGITDIEIGKAEDVNYIHEIWTVHNAFMIGSLLAFGIYYLLVYIFRRKEIIYLFYSLWGISLTIRIASTYNLVVIKIFQNLNWEILIKLEIVSLYLIAVLGTLYWKFFLYNRASKIISNIFLTYGIINILLCLTTPALFYTQFLTYGKIYLIIVIFYYFYSGIMLIIRKDEGSLIIVIGMIFMFLGVSNEIISTVMKPLLNINIFNNANGFFVFFIFLAFMMSRRFSIAYNKVEKLTLELLQNKQELEIKVEERTKDLKVEKEKSDQLLLNVLPEQIAQRLKSGETTIADHFEEASVIFIDIADFTKMSAKSTPQKMVNMLNEIFSIFDKISAKYGLEKIKTIGDCYMAAAGIPVPREDHAHAIAKMALEVMETMKEYSYSSDDFKSSDESCIINFRIGLDCGPIVAGVIGEQKFIYDLWGDMVNTASRMETNGIIGKIQCTERFKKKIEEIPLNPTFSKGESGAGGLLPFSKGESGAEGFLPLSNDESSELPSLEKGGQGGFFFEERGEIEVKGKGMMRTYFLENSR